MCGGDRTSSESFRCMSVPILVRSQQEPDLQSDARCLRTTYSDDRLDDLPTRLRRRRAYHSGTTDDRASADTPATRLDRRLAPVQDHTRSSSVAREPVVEQRTDHRGH